jgi:hypothetical protein
MTQEDQTVKFGRIMMIVVLFFVLIACEEKEGMKSTSMKGMTFIGFMKTYPSVIRSICLSLNTRTSCSSVGRMEIRSII